MISLLSIPFVPLGDPVLYRPGSALFFVWKQQPAYNIFLIEATYWFGG